MAASLHSNPVRCAVAIRSAMRTELSPEGGASRGSPAALLVDGSASDDLRGAVFARNVPWMGKHAIASPPSRPRQRCGRPYRRASTDWPSGVERDVPDHPCHRAAKGDPDPLSVYLSLGLPNGATGVAGFGQSGTGRRQCRCGRCARDSGRESYSCASNRLVIDADPIASRSSGCRTKPHLRPPKGQTNAARVLVTFRSGKTINLRILVESR
jgi:hypothetical protein